MKLIRVCAALGIMTLVGTGCVPEPLTGLDDAGGGNNMNSMNADTGMNSNTTNGMSNGGGGFSTEFVSVAEILRTNCALSGCHDAAMPFPNQSFEITGGMNAQPADVQSGIEGVTAMASPNMLIAPGSAAMSEIYIRITKPSGDAMLMGQGAYGAAATPLPMDQITTIETWINNGATYMQ